MIKTNRNIKRKNNTINIDTSIINNNRNNRNSKDKIKKLVPKEQREKKLKTQNKLKQINVLEQNSYSNITIVTK